VYILQYSVYIDVYSTTIEYIGVYSKVVCILMYILQYSVYIGVYSKVVCILMYILQADWTKQMLTEFL